jgi:hypothetical protein
MARGEIQRLARALVIKAAERIKALKPEEIKAELLPRILGDMQRVIERTLGVADATVRVESNDPFYDWTMEELLEYAKTGKLPKHELLKRNMP